MNIKALKKIIIDPARITPLSKELVELYNKYPLKSKEDLENQTPLYINLNSDLSQFIVKDREYMRGYLEDRINARAKKYLNVEVEVPLNHPLTYDLTLYFIKHLLLSCIPLSGNLDPEPIPRYMSMAAPTCMCMMFESDQDKHIIENINMILACYDDIPQPPKRIRKGLGALIRFIHHIESIDVQTKSDYAYLLEPLIKEMLFVYLSKYIVIINNDPTLSMPYVPFLRDLLIKENHINMNSDYTLVLNHDN